MRTLLLVSIVPVLVTCPKSSTLQVKVGKVLVDDALGSDGVELGRDPVRQAFVQALSQPSRKTLVFKKGAPGRLRIKAMTGRVPPGASGSPVVVLHTTLQFKTVSGHQNIETTVEQKSETASEQPSHLLDLAVTRTIAGLDELVQLQSKSSAQLVLTAQGQDRALRLRALSVLAARAEGSTLDGVLSLLEDPDEAVVLRAVGVVVAIGDPRGVRPLTDLTHRRSPTFVRQIVYAVASLGGREAEAYLFTVATGHSDPGVQEAARRAAKTLEKKSQSKTDPESRGDSR